MGGCDSKQGESQIPSVFTSVLHFQDWIDWKLDDHFDSGLDDYFDDFFQEDDYWDEFFQDDEQTETVLASKSIDLGNIILVGSYVYLCCIFCFFLYWICVKFSVFHRQLDCKFPSTDCGFPLME